MTRRPARTVYVKIDGVPVPVAAGASIAAALALCPPGTSRTSVNGERRAPFCGMGICQECRVSVDGRRRLACQTACAEGMEIHTHDPATVPEDAP